MFSKDLTPSKYHESKKQQKELVENFFSIHDAVTSISNLLCLPLADGYWNKKFHPSSIASSVLSASSGICYKLSQAVENDASFYPGSKTHSSTCTTTYTYPRSDFVNPFNFFLAQSHYSCEMTRNNNYFDILGVLLITGAVIALGTYLYENLPAQFSDLENRLMTLIETLKTLNNYQKSQIFEDKISLANETEKLTEILQQISSRQTKNIDLHDSLEALKLQLNNLKDFLETQDNEAYFSRLLSQISALNRREKGLYVHGDAIYGSSNAKPASNHCLRN